MLTRKINSKLKQKKLSKNVEARKLMQKIGLIDAEKIKQTI
jgi:hypothetical protein